MGIEQETIRSHDLMGIENKTIQFHDLLGIEQETIQSHDLMGIEQKAIRSYDLMGIEPNTKSVPWPDKTSGWLEMNPNLAGPTNPLRSGWWELNPNLAGPNPYNEKMVGIEPKSSRSHESL